jgi:hypothetical protein
MVGISDIIPVRRFALGFVGAVFISMLPMGLASFYIEAIPTPPRVVFYTALATFGVTILLFYVAKLKVTGQITDDEED